MSSSPDARSSGVASDPRDRSGEVLQQKYRLLRRIGEGGMGTVYEAQHVVLGRRFAVKFLQSDLSQNESALARFRREAEAAGSLENEHIAAVVDFDRASDGSPYLVMEYLVGESLGRLLQREGPLPPVRAVGALLQVCRGLEIAHAAGIIHRDLKPDNLFLVRRTDGSDLIKILDFGVAKLQRDGDGATTRTGATLGTPFYMAPEQARGERQVDQRLDIYALGVILYELLSGQKPHPGDNYNAILAHILNQEPRSLAALCPHLPPKLVAIVHRAMAFDPGDRPPSVAALGRELAAFGGRGLGAVGSQLELSVASGDAPTLPGQTTSAPPHSQTHFAAAPPTEGSGQGLAPASPGRSRSRVALGLGTLGLLGGGVALALLWSRAPAGELELQPQAAPSGADTGALTRPPGRAPSVPASPSALAPGGDARASGRPAAPAGAGAHTDAASSASPAPNVAAAPHASTPAPPAAPRVDTDAGRPAPSVGRPRTAAPVGRARAPSPTATPQPPPPSPPKSAEKQPEGGVLFDTKNPYE